MDAAHRERLELARLRNIEYMRKYDLLYSTANAIISSYYTCSPV